MPSSSPTTNRGFDHVRPRSADRTTRYWSSYSSRGSLSASFCQFWNATYTVPFGPTVGTENVLSSHAPLSIPSSWSVQSARLVPEMTLGVDHVNPPSVLVASKIGEDA